MYIPDQTQLQIFHQIYPSVAPILLVITDNRFKNKKCELNQHRS